MTSGNDPSSSPFSSSISFSFSNSNPNIASFPQSGVGSGLFSQPLFGTGSSSSNSSGISFGNLASSSSSNSSSFLFRTPTSSEFQCPFAAAFASTRATSSTAAAASSATMSSIPSSSLSTKTSPAASTMEPQSTAAETLFEIPCFGCPATIPKVELSEVKEEEMGDGVVKQPDVQRAKCEAQEVSGVCQYDDDKGSVMETKMEGLQESVECALGPTNSIVAEETITVRVVVSAAASLPTTSVMIGAPDLKSDEVAVGQEEATAAATLFGTPYSFGGEAEEEEEEEERTNRVVQQQDVESTKCEAQEVSGACQYDNDKGGSVMETKTEGLPDSAECALGPTNIIVAEEIVIVPVVAPASASLPITSVMIGTPDLKSDEVAVGQEKRPEKSIVVSEVVSKNEIGDRGILCQTSSILFQFRDVEDVAICPWNGLILEQILLKYGDISKGSMLKSMAAKSSFMQLVADVVYRLCNNTVETIDCDELQLIQTRTDDAVAVGFRVDWLQQRVNEVVSASKYQGRLRDLVELGQQIDDAKKSLMEMELRQKVWRKEVASMKAEMEGKDLSGSSLGEGLL